MIIYKISTGELFAQTDADGPQALIGHGYAGNGECLDDPDKTWVKMHGPLPMGEYIIESPEDKPESVGAYALALTPSPGNQMYDRGSFFVHGDNPQMDHTASDGCIVCPRPVREIVAQHQLLTVTA